MTAADYLKQVGLEEIAARVDSEDQPTLVASPPHRTFSTDEVESLYTYPVPETDTDGACDVGLADEPYNLACARGLEYDPDRLRDHPNTARLAALDETVQNLAGATGADWIGIYRKTTVDDRETLIKEAYVGEESRAEFPLTEEFAERSNNVTVARAGEAVLVDDVTDYDGPYYECDFRVASEFCCPILTPDGEVVGIIDTEAHEPEFFDDETVARIAQACRDLGTSPLLTPPKVEY